MTAQQTRDLLAVTRQWRRDGRYIVDGNEIIARFNRESDAALFALAMADYRRLGASQNASGGRWYELALMSLTAAQRSWVAEQRAICGDLSDEYPKLKSG